MQAAAVIPWLDIFLALIFLGLLILGFWQGLLRGVWFLLSIYAAAVLASLYGDLAARLFGASIPDVAPGQQANTVSSALGFFVVFALVTVILYAVLSALFGNLQLRHSLLWLDKSGGILVGLLTAFVLTSFCAYILNGLLSAPGPREWAFFTILRNQRTTSPLIQAFLSARPVLLAVIRPLLPGGLPAFLR